MVDENRISQFLKDYLRRSKLDRITAVEAARVLDEAGLLRDRPARRGAPLRKLLRAGKICCSRKCGRFWFIYRNGSRCC